MLGLIGFGVCVSCALFPKIGFEPKVPVMLKSVFVEGVSTCPSWCASCNIELKRCIESSNRLRVHCLAQIMAHSAAMSSLVVTALSGKSSISGSFNTKVSVVRHYTVV